MLIMENPEEILQILERFAKLKQKDIPKELNEYLSFVAKTGDTVYRWEMIKYLFREKLMQVIKDFHDTSITDLPQYPNVDPFNYDTMKNALLERLEAFHAAPFTVQRICELLTDPRKQYSRIDKFMRAVEKNILVVSTSEPGRRRTDSENGDSIINGDLSSESIDSDMDNDSFPTIPTQNAIIPDIIKESPENDTKIDVLVSDESVQDDSKEILEVEKIIDVVEEVKEKSDEILEEPMEDAKNNIEVDEILEDSKISEEIDVISTSVSDLVDDSDKIDDAEEDKLLRDDEVLPEIEEIKTDSEKIEIKTTDPVVDEMIEDNKPVISDVKNEDEKPKSPEKIQKPEEEEEDILLKDEDQEKPTIESNLVLEPEIIEIPKVTEDVKESIKIEENKSTEEVIPENIETLTEKPLEITEDVSLLESSPIETAPIITEPITSEDLLKSEIELPVALKEEMLIEPIASTETGLEIEETKIEIPSSIAVPIMEDNLLTLSPTTNTEVIMQTTESTEMDDVTSNDNTKMATDDEETIVVPASISSSLLIPELMDPTKIDDVAMEVDESSMEPMDQ